MRTTLQFGDPGIVQAQSISVIFTMGLWGEKKSPWDLRSDLLQNFAMKIFLLRNDIRRQHLGDPCQGSHSEPERVDVPGDDAQGVT